MKLYYHMSIPYLSNTYIAAAENSGAAILIDPGTMDVQLLELIEGHGYYIRSILITRMYESHVKGIKTILRIYDANIYSANHSIEDIPCRVIGNGDTFSLHGLPMEIYGAQGFSRDALLIKIKNALFTGDVLTAGCLGEAANAFSKALLVTKLRERFAELDDRTVIFPGYGPPSTVGIERKYNRHLHPQN